MKDQTGMHSPSPEFRAALEDEIVGTMRRDSRFESPRSWWRRERMRSVVVLFLGLLLGVGTQLASAQVRDVRERTELERAAGVNREVAMLRLRLAQANHEQARAAFEAGVISREALLKATSEMRSAQATVARIDLDIAEIRAAAATPRNELWAPIVSDRDFVRERLALDIMVSQQRLEAAEEELADAERRYRVGVISETAMSEARLRSAAATRELQLLAQRMNLRDQFLRERLTSDEVARRERRVELTLAVQRVSEQAKAASVRAEQARERFAVSAIDELTLRRAELEVLELSVELQQLMVQLREVDAGVNPEGR